MLKYLASHWRRLAGAQLRVLHPGRVGDVSVPGSTETELCSRGIFSIMVASDLDRIRGKFGLAGEVSLAVPSGEAFRH